MGKKSKVSTLSKFDGIDEFGEYRIDGKIKLYKKYSNRMLTGGLRYFVNTQLKLRGGDYFENIRPAYFEFGVFNGRATHSFINFIKRKGSSYGLPLESWDFFLFDSWEGLPEQQDKADVIAGYKVGDYKSNGEDYVQNRLIAAGLKKSQIHTFPGWFADTLNDTTKATICDRPIVPAFVCLDCDYYSSTLEALNWVEPILTTGTPLYFDDILMYFGSNNKGQICAINEFNDQRSTSGVYRQIAMDTQNRMYTYWNDKDIESKTTNQ